MASLKDKFKNLAALGYILRCPRVTEEAHDTGNPDTSQMVPIFETEWREDVPEVDWNLIAKQLNHARLGDHSDSNILWRVNFDSFDNDMRL